MSESKQRVIGNIIIALILSVAIIFSCFIGVNGLAEYKRKKDKIHIKGYVTKQITSDLILWTGYYVVKANDIKEGYGLLEPDRNKVKNYLVGMGFKEEELIFSSISINEEYTYVQNETGYRKEITNYNLSQTVTISSNEIDKVTEVSRSSTELLNEGVEFHSYAPEYLYTKLDELKITMLAEATQDATNRAGIIAENAGSKLGKLTNAKISFTSVKPLNTIPKDYYYEYGDYVKNDSVSLEKEVTLAVDCSFEIK